MSLKLSMKLRPGRSQPKCPECGERFLLDLMGQRVARMLGSDAPVIATPCCGVFLEMRPGKRPRRLDL